MVRCNIAMISMGSRVRGEGHGEVLHSSSRAVNLLIDQRVLTILNRDGILSPSSIILDVEEIPTLVWARLSNHSLETDSFRVPLGDPVPLSLEISAKLDRQGTIDLLSPFLIERDYSISKAMLHLRGIRVRTTTLERAVMLKQAEILGDSKNLLEVSRGLIGLGYGLTPSGDDFILGIIGLMRLLDLDPRPLSPTIMRYENPFPRTILLDAIKGHFSVPLLGLLKALAESDDRVVQRHIEGLLQVGHSSGVDTLAGMVYFLERVVGM